MYDLTCQKLPYFMPFADEEIKVFYAKLIVLSYHRFSAEESDYQYSRTFDKFKNDIVTKTFDWITIDDAHYSSYYACEILKGVNIRAKIFVSTALIGSSNDYCIWQALKVMSLHHDIENHSHEHINLTELSNDEILYQIKKANEMIEDNIGKSPRYFVPPFNKANKHVQNCAEKCGLQLVNNRIDVLNISE